MVLTPTLSCLRTSIQEILSSDYSLFVNSKYNFAGAITDDFDAIPEDKRIIPTMSSLKPISLVITLLLGTTTSLATAADYGPCTDVGAYRCISPVTVLICDEGEQWTVSSHCSSGSCCYVGVDSSWCSPAACNDGL